MALLARDTSPANVGDSPRNLSAYPVIGQATLNRDASTYGTPMGCRFQQRVSWGEWTNRVEDTTTGREYVDTSIEHNTSYSYRIRVIYAEGKATNLSGTGQAALAEDQGGPDYGVWDTHILKNLFQLPLASEVGQPGFGRGVCNREVEDPSDARPCRRVKQHSGVLHRLVEGGQPPPEPDPVGVVENSASLNRPAQPVRVGEVQGSRWHQAAERTFPARVAGQSAHADALVQQAPGDVPPSKAEGAGYYG